MSTININYFKNGTIMTTYAGDNIHVEKISKETFLTGSDGKPTKITQITKSNCKLYEITQDRGETYIVDENHTLILKFTNVEGVYWDTSRQRWKARYIMNLCVKDKCFAYSAKEKNLPEEEWNEVGLIKEQEAFKFLKEISKQKGYNRKGDILKITIKDYLKLQPNIKRSLYGFKNYIDYPKQYVELDPYMLGLWLGDGTSAGSQMTTHIDDIELINYYTKFANENDLIVKKSEAESTKYRYNFRGKFYRDNSFLSALQQYNLTNNKHIPDDYLYNDKQTRLAVLAGFIDTDGHYTKDGNCFEIMQKSTKVATDLAVLTRSLGFKTTLSKCNKTCTNSKNGPKTAEYNKVYISGENLDEIPVLLPRKKAKPATKGIDFLVTTIKVKEVGEGECTGFTLDNANGEFLLSDLTVAHC